MITKIKILNTSQNLKNLGMPANLVKMTIILWLADMIIDSMWKPNQRYYNRDGPNRAGWRVSLQHERERPKNKMSVFSASSRGARHGPHACALRGTHRHDSENS